MSGEGEKPIKRIYALDLIRALFYSNAANDIFATGIALVTDVACMQDEHNWGPARFYNEAVARRIGVTENGLKKIRDRCIEHGWLAYQPSTKGSRGSYWAMVPGGAIGFDASVDHAKMPPTKLEERRAATQKIPPTQLGERRIPPTLPPTVPPTQLGAQLPPISLIQGSKFHDHDGTKAGKEKPNGYHKPNWRVTLKREHLRDGPSLLILFQQAVDQGCIGASDADRITFFAVAHFCARKGRQSPGGYFTTLLGKHPSTWSKSIGKNDEDWARRTIESLLNGASAIESRTEFEARRSAAAAAARSERPSRESATR